MNTPTIRPAKIVAPAPVTTSKPAASPAIDADPAKAASTATVRKAEPIQQFTRPVKLPSPPFVEKPAPVAARGDDDLMSQRQ